MAALFEDLLMRRESVGEGELGRLLRDLQRRHFQPPSDEPSSGGNFGAHWPQPACDGSRVEGGGLNKG